MKKLFSILLCSLLVLSLSGCGSKKEEDNNQNKTTTNVNEKKQDDNKKVNDGSEKLITKEEQKGLFRTQIPYTFTIGNEKKELMFNGEYYINEDITGNSDASIDRSNHILANIFDTLRNIIGADMKNYSSFEEYGKNVDLVSYCNKAIEQLKKEDININRMTITGFNFVEE